MYVPIVIMAGLLAQTRHQPYCIYHYGMALHIAILLYYACIIGSAGASRPSP